MNTVLHPPPVPAELFELDSRDGLPLSFHTSLALTCPVAWPASAMSADRDARHERRGYVGHVGGVATIRRFVPV